LRADAIGEVIEPIVREIEYGVAHGVPILECTA
jgi:hypothetical protein